MTLSQKVIKKWLLPFVLCFSMIFAISPQSEVSAASLRDKSRIIFDGTPDGKVYTTRAVWVPHGAQVGVYVQNNNSWWDGTANLKVSLLNTEGSSWTHRLADTTISRGEILSQRLSNNIRGKYWYLHVTCDANPGADCDGTATISSWY
ncbi:hypothetical protein OKW24_005678 [Peribacillus simplex]|uniref:hypothetical protein n=1 Tax=Peribacillus simplex TaxID=1478 RepID=UPI0024E23258|nr:hypothetical protein [Peribacillus simplex]MDF9763782.1 hypothetical protein [Peribacillus simplex]